MIGIDTIVIYKKLDYSTNYKKLSNNIKRLKKTIKNPAIYLYLKNYKLFCTIQLPKLFNKTHNLYIINGQSDLDKAFEKINKHFSEI